MQRMNAGKKKRILAGSVAGVLTVAIVSTALYNDSSVAYARPSLPGIEQIVSENSSKKPFKILEIVDNYASARIGYTVAGEEPGFYDDYGVAALSDMASKEERANRYMAINDNGTPADPSDDSPADTNPSKNPTSGYSDLVGAGKAATYNQFLEEGSAEYDADTTSARNYSVYGSYEPNSGNNGYYKENDQFERDYRHVQRDENDAETKFNLTIDQVIEKNPASDQTGIFYMHHIRLGEIDDATKDPATNLYDIDYLTKITSGESWKYPFKIGYEEAGAWVHGYTETYTAYLDDPNDPNAKIDNLIYYFYDEDLYVPNDDITVSEDNIDDNSTPDDKNDDIYSIESSTMPNEGDLIFLNKGDRLDYIGYVKADPGDSVFKFYDKNDTPMYPVEGPSSAEGTAESLAEYVTILASTTGEKICTIRPANDDDSNKFYINSISQNANGKYQIYTGFDEVNNPDYEPEEYGIEDESDRTPAWYHQWYYIRGEKPKYVYVPAKTGNYDFAHDYAGEEINSFKYKGGYTNNEWFKNYVLDIDDAQKQKEFCIDVITKKANEVTPKDIEDANLVYFTGGNYDADMAPEASVALLRAVYNDNKAVIINVSCFTAKISQQFSFFDDMGYMMCLLFQSDLANIGDYVNDDNTWKLNDNIKNSLKTLGDKYVAATNDVSHVTNTIFVNDDRRCRDAIYTDGLADFGKTKIEDGFDLNGNHYDFMEVKNDIDQEVFYLKVAGKYDDSDFNETVCKATSIRYILNYGDRRSVAKTEINVLDIEPYYNPQIESGYVNGNDNGFPERFLLREDNGVSKFEKRDIFTKKWFTDNLSDTTDGITINGVGTKTFIGRIEDLNENYDLIYIGMDTAYLNTDSSNGTKRFLNNDKQISSNDGFDRIYRHDGDEVYMAERGTKHHGSSADKYYNLSGNDITPDKLYELKNYVKAGYAVILSDYFFDENSTVDSYDDINTELLDDNSYLYEFVKFCIKDEDDDNKSYLYKNVEIKKNLVESTGNRTTDGKSVAVHKDNFLKYLNISKLQIIVKDDGTPPLYNPYDIPDSVPQDARNDYHHYIEMNSVGQYTLDFKIELKNDAATDTTNTSYDCQLYIDHDGDGRFESVEMLNGLDIVRLSDNESINVDDDGKYHLRTGTTYSISRAVPEGYFGLISWKLVFIENGRENDMVKVAIQDYSALRNMAGKQQIRVLQLTSGDTMGTNLNLWDDPNIVQLYNQVQDFELSVESAPITDLINLNRPGGYFNGVTDRFTKLCEYDILVLGFSDAYLFPFDGFDNNAIQAVLAIREYMLSGRSILFTHDLTSTRTINDDNTRTIRESWDVGFGNRDVNGLNMGYLANTYLRDIQGMDRYGYTHRTDSPLLTATYNGNALTEYKSVYDTKTQLTGDKLTGFTDSNLSEEIKNDNRNRTTYGEVSRFGSPKLWAGYNDGVPWGQNGINDDPTYHFAQRDSRQVARLNRGQITEYPFRIGQVQQGNDGLWHSSEFIDVATTHNQWFQLNLDTNYRDTNYDDDVVVWFTLSTELTKESNDGRYGQYHRLNYMDARNNYYIFNKGNVTYTGAGHSMISDSKVDERKLFVNTLVASYNAGTHAPYAAYKNGPGNNSVDITSKYVPYDLALSKIQNEYGRDNGFLENKITVYFKAVNNNLQDNRSPLVTQYYVESINNNGDVKIGAKSYWIVSPDTVTDCTTGSAVTDKQVLENGHIYKLEFNIADLFESEFKDGTKVTEAGVTRKYQAKIYTRMRSRRKVGNSATAAQEAEALSQDLAEMNVRGSNAANPAIINALPASDSFKPLNVNFTQLYDLK